MTLLFQRGIMHLLCSKHIMIILPSPAHYCISRILHLCLFVHMHHTGLQENKVDPEEQEETLVQGLPEGHEPEEEL